MMNKWTQTKSPNLTKNVTKNFDPSNKEIEEESLSTCGLGLGRTRQHVCRQNRLKPIWIWPWICTLRLLKQKPQRQNEEKIIKILFRCFIFNMTHWHIWFRFFCKQKSYFVFLQTENCHYMCNATSQVINQKLFDH